MSIWRNKNITTGSFVRVAILLCLVYVFIFHIFVPLGKQFSFVKDIDQTCLCEHDNYVIRELTNRSRGKQYYLTGDGDLNNCGITLWEGSHIFMHVLIGYWLDLRWSLLIGSSFELWEWRKHDCENVLDIFYNSVGAIIGGLCRELYT